MRNAFVNDDQIPTHVESLGIGRINRKTQQPFTDEQRLQFAVNNAMRFAGQTMEEGHGYVAITNQRIQANQLITACATRHPVVLDVSFEFTTRDGEQKTGHKWAILVGKDLDRSGLVAMRALNIALQTKVWQSDGAGVERPLPVPPAGATQ